MVDGFWPNMVAEVVFGGVLERVRVTFEPKNGGRSCVWTDFGQKWWQKLVFDVF